MKVIKYISLTVIIVVLIITPVNAQMKVGGEFKNKVVTLSNSYNNTEIYLQQKLNLELYLPINQNTEANFEGNLAYIPLSSNPNLRNEVSHTIDKFYLERYYPKFDITVGRQPISWSFGSLLNPVDFTLGAEAMTKENSAKNIDAVEVYYPLDWSSSITGTIATLDEQIKIGVRGRTYINNYDLSINYVTGDKDTEPRIGISSKGDVGPLGVYGAASYYYSQKDPVILVGTDYSFYINDINKLVLQLEYLRDQANFAEGVLGEMIIINVNDNLNLGKNIVSAMVSYELDNFSSIESYFMISPQNKSMTLLGAEYKNQITNKLDFTIGSYYIAYNNMSQSGIEVEFSYPF